MNNPISICKHQKSSSRADNSKGSMMAEPTLQFKAPLFPFINWLIFLHVYSPTFISVLLASFYLKLSAIFFLFFFIYFNSYIIFFFSLLTILFCLFLLFLDINYKRLIAFSSIFHCSFSFFFLFFYFLNLNLNYLILIFILIQIIHAFCSGFFFYLFGLYVDVIFLKTNKSSLFMFMNFYLLILLFYLSLFYFSFPLFLSFLLEIYVLLSFFS